MTVAITIIGLNRIGASIGLALASQKHQLTRTGIDREPDIARQAQKLGAVDNIVFNLEKAVKDADVVILCVPLDDLEENLRVVLPSLKPGAVVLDTSPVQVKVYEMVKPLLPADRHFVSLYPTLNPGFISETSNSTADANSSLFQNSLCIISSPPETDEAALKLAADLTSLLGAKPYFSDPYEVDGLLGMVHLLPRLAAVALTHVTFAQPGWSEARKLAGPAFAAATSPLELDADAKKPGLDAVLNNQNAVRLLDALIEALQEVRNEIAEGKTEALEGRLKVAVANRTRWLNQRKSGDWVERTGPQAPTLADTLGRLVGLRKREKTGEKK